MITRCLVLIVAFAFLAATLRIVGATPNCAQRSGEVTANPQEPVVPQRKFVITRFGAVGDGKTLNTDPFRKAIAACRSAGGGEVIVPAGTFVTGPIELASNLALVLEKGAIIRGSEDHKDYQNTGKNEVFKEAKTSVLPLIRGANLTDVEIRGEGTIDGTGAEWWKRFRAERAAGVPAQGQPRQPGQPMETPRPKLVWLIGCNRVRIQGVTLKNATC